MPKLKVTLSIGYSNAMREETITIDDDEYNDCESDEKREELIQAYWDNWAYNYIDGGFEVIKE